MVPKTVSHRRVETGLEVDVVVKSATPGRVRTAEGSGRVARAWRDTNSVVMPVALKVRLYFVYFMVAVQTLLYARQ